MVTEAKNSSSRREKSVDSLVPNIDYFAEKDKEEHSFQGSEFSNARGLDIDENVLLTCIAEDLTKGNLESVFPGVREGDIQKMVGKLVPSPNELKLTPGEKALIRKGAYENESCEVIMKNLPFRSYEYVRQRYDEYKVAGTRHTKFRNAQEKLLYEAQWTMLGASSNSRSTKRSGIRVAREGDTRKSNAVYKKPSRKLTEEELDERRRRLKEIAEEKQRIKAERSLERKRRQELREANGESTVKKAKKSFLDELSEASEYFQTISGDRQPINVNSQRRRIQAVHYMPPLEAELTRSSTKKKSRKRNDEIQEANVKNIAKKQTNKEKEKDDSQKSKTFEKSKMQQKSKHKQDKTSRKSPRSHKSTSSPRSASESKQNENVFNPFDPYDVIHDSYVSLRDRKFYSFDVPVNRDPFPDLPFSSLDSEDQMVLDENSYPYCDTLATRIVSTFNKSYRDIGTSFPSLMITDASGNIQVNPYNRLNVRFLIYPEHYESYILAAPKSNELNPVLEIIRLIQIHYALYFSQSQKLKKIIMDDYCKALEKSVEENHFPEFLSIIDKWNLLMLALSPSQKADGLRDRDINEGIRVYLVNDNVKAPSAEELKLDIYYHEIIKEYDYSMDEVEELSEPPSPNYDVVQSDQKLTDILTPPATSEDEKEANVLSDKNLTDTTANSWSFQRPKNYIYAFLSNLHYKKKISRFCLHQIFLRVYSRVVSTKSQKLRSYKAFSAEVYGELLPSFTSEVLSKVNLSPNMNFYDLGSGVGNTTLQAALEFGVRTSGGCEIMEHASKLTSEQVVLIQKYLKLFGLEQLNLNFALSQSFVDNEKVKEAVLNSEVLIINNYLFDANLNNEVGRLLYGIKPGSKIISLRNFIRPRYKATGDSAFDYFRVEKHEMSSFLSVSWTANKVPYYISTVEDRIRPEYL